MKQAPIKILCLIVTVILFSMSLVFCGQDKQNLLDTDEPGTISNPDESRYHWDGQTDPYFEGWYFKINQRETGLGFFFIYGVIFPGNQTSGEAFLHFGGGHDGRTVYKSFPLDSFSAGTEDLDVVMGKNKATKSRIIGEVLNNQKEFRWDIDIEQRMTWDKTMGSYTDSDELDVNWQVEHLSAVADGFIEWDGQHFELDNALAYSDHNWGPEFPSYYMWMQGAHFPNRVDAFSLSGGAVNGLLGERQAYMIGYYRDGELLTFRTQDMARIYGFYDDLIWTINAEKGNQRLTIWASADQATMFRMLAPTLSGMKPIVNESLTGVIGVTYWVRDGRDWIEMESRTTDLAGVEIGGVWPYQPE